MTFLNNFVADCNVMDERRTVHIPFLLYNYKKYAYVYISSLHNNANGSKEDNVAVHFFTFTH